MAPAFGAERGDNRAWSDGYDLTSMQAKRMQRPFPKLLFAIISTKPILNWAMEPPILMPVRKKNLYFSIIASMR